MAPAFVCKTKGLALVVNWGYPKIGACMSLHFNVVNAPAPSSVHTKGAFFGSTCVMDKQYQQIS